MSTNSAYLGVPGGKMASGPQSTYLTPGGAAYGSNIKAKSPSGGNNTTSAYFSAPGASSSSGTTSTYLAPGGAAGIVNPSQPGTASPNRGCTTPSRATSPSTNRGKIGELEDRMTRLENDLKEICDRNRRLEAALRSIAADALRELTNSGPAEAKDANNSNNALVATSAASSGNSTMTAVAPVSAAAMNSALNADYFKTPSERSRLNEGNNSGLAPSGSNVTSAYLAPAGSGSGTQSAYFGVGGAPYAMKPARNNVSAYMGPTGGAGGAPGTTSTYMAPK